MRLHLWSGITLLTLLVFRIVWGVFGSTTARFSNFVTGPSGVRKYLVALLSENKPHYPGHNPAGGLMVLTLIAALFAQGIIGMYSNDGVRFNGPLALWVSTDISDRLTEVHGVLFNIILSFIWVHLVAVFFYLFVKRENLITPMVTGYKHREHVPTNVRLKFAHWGAALVALVAAAFAVSVVFFL